MTSEGPAGDRSLALATDPLNVQITGNPKVTDVSHFSRDH